jgi:ABC-2 type transport system ATP-binding protein
VVASLRDLGKTVFLTTHYMEEAQALADRVAIIARGRIVAQGSPGELAGRGGSAARISFRIPPGAPSADLPPRLAATVGNGEVRLDADDPVRVLHELTSWALERRIPLAGLEVRRPTLEDVYLELTAGEREESAE